MKTMQKILAVVLVAALAGTIYGIVKISESATAASTKATKAAAGQLVDQSALRAARQLAGLADTEDERSLAKDALRLGDYELDLAFDIALRDADAHPPTLTAEAKAIQARLQKAQRLQERLQAQVTQLTTEAAKATGARKDELTDQLSLAKSSLDLANNEVQDAEGDLTDAGGNQRGRIQQLKEAHEQAGHAKDPQSLFPAPAGEQLGLIHRYQDWTALRAKLKLLNTARAQADAAAAAAVEQHEALAAQIEAEKFNSPDLAAHSSLSEDAAAPDANDAAANSVVKSVEKKRTRAESKEALVVTKAITDDQQNLTSLDKRADNEKELADTYSQWAGLVAARQSRVLTRGLIGIAIILTLILLAILVNTWMDALLGKLKLDRRRVQTLRAVTRVTLQVASVVLILLVTFGPPNQLATFLGLAGAGLIVALKDFIVGFIGWFVLMGKNGIRLGDWVEINGVTGEVVETGMFHTVLLETGNWTDSGHPTGRRVTFTNGYAIEGHYFNFSTSGQWLWDELQVTIPADRDPFPLVEAIQKRVLEETKESSEQAEAEWKKAAGSRDLREISAGPAINVRPAPAGVEVQVRYVTRAGERHQVRAKLYQAIVDLLGRKGVPPPKPITEGPASKVA